MKTFGYRAAIGFAVSLALATAAQARDASTSDKVDFDIDAPSLVQALMQFTQQSGLQLMMPADSSTEAPAPRVAGHYTAVAALEQLLAGSSLSYTFANSRTIAIRSAANAAAEGATIRLAQSSGGSRSSTSSSVAASVDTGSRFQATSEEEIDEVVITGTHIRGVGPGSSPLISYNRRDIERSGASTVEQFVRQIPQNFGALNSGTASGGTLNLDAATNSTYGTAMDLHGLGPGATLVLINGHRVAPAGSNGSFVDVSMIPLSAIERVEILTDGASAIYGADAVGGVVNFILRRQFSGAETSAHYGDTTQGGSEQRSISQLLGGGWNSGHALLSYEYSAQDPLEASDRDYIPGLNGPRFVMPDQRRHSAFVSAEQTLTPALTLRGDGFFSTRDFSSDGSNGFAVSHNEGTEKLYGATLSLGADLPGDWHADGTVSFAEQKGENLGEARFGTTTQVTRLQNQSTLSSVELLVSGSALNLPAGPLKMSVGAGARREQFDDLSVLVNAAGAGLDRDVTSVFGEVLIPVISNPSGRFGARRLELSIAGRYDHYDQFGSSTNPKYGVRWSLLNGLDLRSTYGTAFRAPTLTQLSTQGIQYAAVRFAAPTGGPINTIYVSAPGNAALTPEESESFTAGFDLKLASLPQLMFSATYYKVRYTDRIAQPPVVGSVAQIYFQQAALAQFIDFAPDSARLQEIYSSGRLNNPQALPASSIRAIYDNRLQNLAISRTSGIDAQTSYSFEPSFGNVSVFLSANYIFDLDYQATTTSATTDVLNTLFRPVDFRGRVGASWSARGFSSTWSLSYVNGYDNTLVTPVQSIGSWTTVDAQFSYRTDDSAGSALRGITLSLNAQNLFDRDPPLFDPGPTNPTLYRFDPANATALGRLISIDLRKRW